MAALLAETALLPGGWARDVRLDWDAGGTLVAVSANAPAAGLERARGPVLPGMPNLHSHAFQRAMAGLTERASGEGDNFWTWRQAMYGFVQRLDPDMQRAIAAQLYVEMLRAGYTAVAEFHYVHHDKDGRPYADRCVMSEAVIAAADEAGIRQTLLPVLYQSGGFGGVPPSEGQRRYLSGTDEFLALVTELRRRHPAPTIGVAPHSIRAVPPDGVRAAAALGGPVHIHIAEQVREVEECVAWSGRRSVDYLLDEMEVGPDWCLVHATHLTDDETRRLAASGAVAGLCPTTEANLGDGIFPFTEYKGVWGIGSDSHISVSPVEELRWLEYGQRLIHRRRNVAAQEGSTAAALLRGALAGGAQALGQKIGAIEEGRRADLVVLRDDLPTLWGRTDDDVLDAAVFAGNDNPVKDVMVGGRWVIRDGAHARQREIFDAYKRAIA
jgi:formimidoylglutamate deiminase